jgi:hypothetical protein
MIDFQLIAWEFAKGFMVAFYIHAMGWICRLIWQAVPFMLGRN